MWQYIKVKGQVSRSEDTRSQAVPGSSFDRLQYKNGGEGLGERVTCVTSGRREGTVDVSSWGAVPDRCNSQTLR